MNPARRLRSQGFTLIELLTVIAIIGVLAAIIIPVTGKVRDHAKRARCVSNVRQISLLLVNLANQDKQQRFPNVGKVGTLPWDILKTRTAATPSTQLTLDDLAKGAGPTVMYCPSAPSVGVDFYTVVAGRAVIDYILLVGAPGQGPAAVLESPVVPNLYHNDRLRAEYKTLGLKREGPISVPASRRELVVDSMAIKGTNYSWATADYKKPGANHNNSRGASGVNVGFVDGHVSWRSIEQMREMSGGEPTPRTDKVQDGAWFVW